ncbi:MAG: DUF4364 family protein [Eubacteriales bacterium]|nr:DUF4364 family protein [Eubacteriales bacterium]
MADKSLIFTLCLLTLFPGLREDELVRHLTDSLYLDYFRARDNLQKLLARGLARQSERKNELQSDAQGKKVLRFDATPEGYLVAKNLSAQLPANMQTYLRQLRLREDGAWQNRQTSEIELLSDGTAALLISASEGHKNLLELKINLPDLNLADQLKKIWDEDSAKIYQAILEALLAQLGD